MISALLGCSTSNSTQPVVEVVKEEPKYEVEVITIEQQVLEEVGSSPLQFYLPRAAQGGAEKKVEMFFSEFLKEPLPRRVALNPSGVRLTHHQSQPPTNFHYTVDFVPRGERTAVFISCKPQSINISSRSAELNARNLSRFIREGTLELSVLSR